MTLWLPWRRKVEKADEAVQAAEALRDRAQQQQRDIERIVPRVDAVASSLRRRQRSDDLLGSMIGSLLRNPESPR